MMKTLLISLGMLFMFNALAQDNPTQVGHCELLQPETADATGYACGGARWSFTYKGHRVSKCFGSAEKAENKMLGSSFCHFSDELGDNKVLYPDEADKRGYGCNNRKYGITTKGYLSGCYSLEISLNKLGSKGLPRL